MMDRFGAMEAFVRVVETGSFSAAARQLRQGQPALSKTVARLEERLGVRLLLRSSRGLTPTEAGQYFYDRARRAIEEADEAELAARGAGSLLSGWLRFSAPVTFARLQIIPHLPAFLARHPELRIDAVLDDRRVDLVEEAIDVALRMGLPADSTLTARRVGSSRRVLLATPGYIAREGAPEAPAALTGHDAVIYAQRGGGSTWSFRRDDEMVAVTLRERVRMTAAEGVREAVLAGLGVAVATEWMFQAELASGAAMRLLDAWELPEAELWAAYPAGRRPSAKARAFAGFVQELLAPHPAPRAGASTASLPC